MSRDPPPPAALVQQLLGQHGSAAWPYAPPAGTQRGVDVYPLPELLAVLGRAAANFRETFGFLPDLVAPATFNEHVFRRKLLAPLPVPCPADKRVARDWARERVGPAHLPELAWMGTEPAALLRAAAGLAGRFMLKASHGSGGNLELRLPDDLPARAAEIAARAAGWLAERFGRHLGEWQYGLHPPQLLLERFIELEGPGFPSDWRFFVFHGRVRLAQNSTGRGTALHTAFYTPDWQRIPVQPIPTPAAPDRPRPANLAAMIRLAERLAEGLDFVRVDLYSDGVERVLFGELTFTPNDANMAYTDIRFDRWLGSWFDPGMRG